jgi:tetratricopeptide (TPR) repeat protein
MNLDVSLFRLEEVQLLRRLNDPELSYHFKHALVQEAVYSSMLLKERRQLHHDVGEALEHLFGGHLDELAAELAHHYALAGNHEKAIAHFIRSGERAMLISAYPEAIQSYENALEQSVASGGADRARLLVRLGEVHDRRSDYAEAKKNLMAGLALAEQQNQAATTAAALCGLAWLASRQGAHDEARRLAHRGLTWAHEAEDPKSTALALRQLGIISNYQGNNDLAVRDLGEALRLCRELNDLEGTARCLNSLGVVAIDQRKLEAAASYFEEALAISRKLGDRYGVGIRLVNLGVIAQEQGDHAAALRYHEEALALAREIGDREGIAHGNLNLGGILVKQGNFAGAMRYYRDALVEALELGLLSLALYIVAAVGEVQVKAGRYEKGATLLGFALRHPGGTADIKSDFDSVLVMLRGTLPAAQLEGAMQQGETLTVEIVAQEILSNMAFGASDGP